MSQKPQKFFACVFPGRPVMTEFKRVSQTRFVLNVPKPASLRDFAITMLTPCIPKDAGATIYFSLPPFKDWQYIGSITVHMPSQIFHSPWRGIIPPNTPGLQIGISIEPKKFIENLHPQSQYEEEKKLISSVQGIAQDVYKFLSSFAKTIPNRGDMLVMPAKCLDQWLKKFEAKHKRDPFFWMKK
uniref:Hikeshi-like domain-containing protein n=1 Tax=Lotharella oceanica TaxID=641309 RepID=A0A7S2TQB2_9EUKA|mmetsp:Transcript_25046/g.46799  ORF Transcript_25046/g.46799 Transcript_25046/m.46799 type:complete len:185 (+) Transcript_25046:88-642(+)